MRRPDARRIQRARKALRDVDLNGLVLASPRRYRWVKRSPLVLLAALVFVGCAQRGPGARFVAAPAAPAAPTATATPPAQPTAPPTPGATPTPETFTFTTGPGPSPQSPQPTGEVTDRNGVDLASPAEVARAFVTAWAQPTLKQQDWLSGVSQYATIDAIGRFGAVNPANTPALVVTGPAVRAPSNDRPGEDGWAVPTSIGYVDVTMRKTFGTWGVVTVGAQPAQSR